MVNGMQGVEVEDLMHLQRRDDNPTDVCKRWSHQCMPVCHRLASSPLTFFELPSSTEPSTSTEVKPRRTGVKTVTRGVSVNTSPR